MPTAESAIIYVESGQTLVAYVAMTDSGDHQIYSAAGAIWSSKSGYAASILPNGIATGGAVTPAASGTNDLVDVAALTAYSAGTLHSVGAAADESLTRATPSDTHIINSITMTSAGAIAVVAGTDGTSFSETRGAAGGPPLLDVDSVEIAQVRLSSNSAAAVTADEIFSVIGTHKEHYLFPSWTVNPIGLGQKATASAEQGAHIKFASVQPLTHTGPIARKVYIQYYTPIFAEISKALDFVPAETSHSVSSTQYYNGTIASRSSSLGQGSFTALLNDGVLDSLVGGKNDILTVKFLPDRNKTPYVLTQGTLGVARTFPVGDQIQAAITISAEQGSSEFAS